MYSCQAIKSNIVNLYVRDEARVVSKQVKIYTYGIVFDGYVKATNFVLWHTDDKKTAMHISQT